MIFYLDLLNINFMVSTYTSNFYTRQRQPIFIKAIKEYFCILYTRKITIVFEVFIFSGFELKKKFASLIKSVFLTSLYKTTLKSTC